MNSRNVDCDNYPNECSQPGKVLDALVGQVQSFRPNTKERRRANLGPHSVSETLLPDPQPAKTRTNSRGQD